MNFKDIGMRILAIVIENGKLSIGRTMLLLTFGLAMYKWATGVDIPATHLNILMAILAYVLGSKVVGNVSDTVKQIKDVKNIVVNNVLKKDEEVEPPSSMKGDN